jgi:N-glycosylase/DNA lyase
MTKPPFQSDLFELRHSDFLRHSSFVLRHCFVRTIDIPVHDFDLALTLDSGQVFHWQKHRDGYAGMIGDHAVHVEQVGTRLRVEGVNAPLVRNYFALDHSLAKICRSFPDDSVMKAARDFCDGLRVIRQPKWECLATFITSSMKQVAHIRQMSRALRKRYGATKTVDELEMHTFPTPERLAATSESELRKCALGYRAKNLLATAQLVASGEADLEQWGALSDVDLRGKLCALPGVGAKVANCVMLFAYERLRAFPIDVWISRTLNEKYFAGKRKPTEAKLRAFAENYFGENGGYAQQYLFHYARKTSSRGRTPRRRQLSAPRT